MAPGTSYESQGKGVKRQLSASPNTIGNKKHNCAIDKAEVTANNINNVKKCEFCHQTQTENVIIPSNAEPECIVLTNEILANIYTDESDGIQHNVTNFCIYDENKHMCSVDSGLIERNVPLYLTGYVKPIYDNSSSIEKGIAAKEMGPILEWWLSSYDGGSQVRIGVCTEYADYILIEPHSTYKKYMASVTEKTHLSRQVLKCLLDSDYDDPTYEDILNYIKNSVNPATCNTFTEEDLIAHAQFVIDQVADYDLYDNHYLPLTETQFIDTLTELSGAVNPGISNRSERRGQRIRVKTDINNKREFSKATTTELVKDIFENMFAAQLNVDDKEENEETMKNRVKTVFDNVCNEEETTIPSEMNNVHIVNNQVMWKDQKLCEKMFILVKKNNSAASFISQIQYFHKANQKVHIQVFIHGFETVLGDTADPKELFSLKKCMDISIKNIIKVVDVTHKQPNDNWFDLGGSKLQDLLEPVNRDSISSFFYQLEYDVEFGRFEYPKFNDLSKVEKYKNCYNCALGYFLKVSQIAVPLIFMETDGKISYYEEFRLYEEVFSIGSFVYLQPGIFSNAQRTNFKKNKPFMHKKINKNKNNQILKKVDETMYPEYYRKTLENTMRGSNETTPDPFEIGEILAVYTHEREPRMMKVVVRRMYRAEHIPLEDYDKNTDMNMLFWSEEEFIVPTVDICGKCYVAFIANIQDPIVWSAGGPDRFYFTKQYDFLTGSVIPDYKLPSEAKLTGKEVYVNYNYNFVDKHKLQKIPSYKKIEPLRGLDIFAGCGGLSRGLEDSGLVKSKWAIECDEKAAAAFELNNPESTVFVDDCNNLLKLSMSGCKTNSKNQIIPQKRDIDFICGGPPCQGFSGMNRFNSGQYSLFKNSLIVSFLSYIDYYRPKYFVMENVRNFASFKSGMVLKLTLRCITRMGYQCTFGILQAGNFGVPQTRRRLIIMAAAPSERLPFYPEPIHVFNRKGSSLSIQVGDAKFKTNCQYGNSAPMRTVTVYDAWSDLPHIKNGANLERIHYKSTPITHLQRLLRYPNDRYSESVLTDHICKDMSPLVQARMEFIPIGEGSDWRDLPNVEIELCDGTTTKKLLYAHNDIKNGALRGVCQCASGGKCNPQDRQSNTIIPWCLPHTGNRHNNWAGLYGRLAWTGFCSTTITNPEPMGKQGRVLHPEQHRVVSVRECARSQGFNDSYLFYGPVINKHRQIGNAVPPPMGVAIGHEIIKAIEKKGNGVFIKKIAFL